MLWLPKWLTADTPPPVEDGVSRRTFLFLGASAAVGALVAPGLESAHLTPTELANIDRLLREIYAPSITTSLMEPSPVGWLMVSRQISHTEALRRWPLDPRVAPCDTHGGTAHAELPVPDTASPDA
jgi:hypothetical protein